jgi:hypothetical protein
LLLREHGTELIKESELWQKKNLSFT